MKELLLGASLTIVPAYVINARLLECVDYLIGHIVSCPPCVASPEFRKLSAGYIACPERIFPAPVACDRCRCSRNSEVRDGRKIMPRVPTG